MWKVKFVSWVACVTASIKLYEFVFWQLENFCIFHSLYIKIICSRVYLQFKHNNQHLIFKYKITDVTK
jgi:hypothetical protein